MTTLYFKTEAEFEAFKKANPGAVKSSEPMAMLPHPACKYCYGTGHSSEFIGGVVKEKPCKCVRPRKLKFARTSNPYKPIEGSNA